MLSILGINPLLNTYCYISLPFMLICIAITCLLYAQKPQKKNGSSKYFTVNELKYYNIQSFILKITETWNKFQCVPYWFIILRQFINCNLSIPLLIKKCFQAKANIACTAAQSARKATEFVAKPEIQVYFSFMLTYQCSFLLQMSCYQQL